MILEIIASDWLGMNFQCQFYAGYNCYETDQAVEIVREIESLLCRTGTN